MKIKAISRYCGAEITNVDLTSPLSSDELDQLLDAWRQYHLLVLPNQQLLTESQQLNFCKYFGPIMPNTRNTEVSVVSNVQSGFTHEGRLSWHMDLAFTPNPIEAICLFGLVVPPEPASTVFANNIQAVIKLEENVREKIQSLKVRNIFDMSINQNVIRYQEPILGNEWPHVYVPLIQNHPLTHEPCLMCCEMFSDPIVGFDKADSDMLLKQLYEVLYADDNILEIPWEQGQLIIWDNSALQHGRSHIPAREGERTLRRITVSECNGYEYFPDIVEKNMPKFRGEA